jgi:hypothetical protein
MPLVRITELKRDNGQWASFRIQPPQKDDLFLNGSVTIKNRDQIDEIIAALGRGETVVQRFNKFEINDGDHSDEIDPS